MLRQLLAGLPAQDPGVSDAYVAERIRAIGFREGCGPKLTESAVATGRMVLGCGGTPGQAINAGERAVRSFCREFAALDSIPPLSDRAYPAREPASATPSWKDDAIALAILIAALGVLAWVAPNIADWMRVVSP